MEKIYKKFNFSYLDRNFLENIKDNKGIPSAVSFANILKNKMPKQSVLEFLTRNKSIGMEYLNSLKKEISLGEEKDENEFFYEGQEKKEGYTINIYRRQLE